MNSTFLHQAFIIISCIATILFKVLYAIVIYFKCNFTNKKVKNTLTYLSIPFPIITGIVCTVKYRKNTKNSFIILIILFLYLISAIAANFVLAHNSEGKYYDKDGKAYNYRTDVSYTDIEGNIYTFDFEKTGYDFLYINNTDTSLNTDWCYLNSEGYLIYDDDMSITAKDASHCEDQDGTLYYPVKFTTFNKDGTINYSFNSLNFKYDRLGNAYTYNNVPYYDIGGNKYFYSFDSNILKGYYTNVSTKKTYENEYCFVDENGFLTYNKENSYSQYDNEQDKMYTDSNGKKYYWASAVYWDKKGNLLLA